MAGTGEINNQDQLDIIQQMNKALQEQNKILQNLANVLGAQAQAAQQVTDASDKVAASQENVKDKLKEVTEAMQENTGGADGLAASLGRSKQQTDSLIGSNEDLANGLGKIVTVGGVASAAIAGMGEAFNAAKITGNLFMDGITTLTGVVTGAVGVVGSFFTGLMSAAADYYNKGAGEIMAANEAIRGSFGDLQSNQGQAVKGMSKNLQTYAKAASAAGTSIFNTFGNLAAVLGEVKEVAEGFGNSFVRLQDQVVGATSEIFLMKKGMALGTDAMKQMASAAEATGTTLQEKLQESMVTAAHLSNQFGVDVKMIGKNFDQMAADVDNFGHLAPKTLMATAAYAAKLGVEVKSLTGLMDGFDTFESAAQNAGKLAEAFGMNVDVMGMMNAENPAERMDMLRKSFEETGKSVNDLSRHELKLLSESMGGMPVDELKNALSMSTDEMGFGDFEDAAEEAAQKMTPEEAMEKVAKSIEKLTNGIANLGKGPLANFLNGFTRAVERSAEFKEIMREVGAFLKEFWKLGHAVGKMFVDSFLKKGSDVRNMISGIFDLKKIKAFASEVKDAFEIFFNMVKTDPKKAIEDLFDKVKNAFDNWFGSGEAAAGVGDMINKLLVNGLKIVAGLAPKIIKTASEYIVTFTKGLKDFLKGDNKVANELGDGVGGAFMMAFTAIKDALVKDLLPVLGDLFYTLMKAAAPVLIPILAGVFAIILAKSLLSAAIAAVAGAVMKKVALVILNGLSKAMGGKLGVFGGKAQPNLSPNAGKKGTSMAETVGDLIEALKKIKRGDVFKAAGVIIALAFTLAVALLPLGAAMVALAALFSLVSFIDVIKAIIGTTTAVIAGIALYAAADKLGKPNAQMFQGILGLAAVLAVGGLAVGLAALVMTALWQFVDIELFVKSILALAAAAVAGLIFALAVLPMALLFVGPAALIMGAAMLGFAGVLAAASLLAGPAQLFASSFEGVDTESFAKGMIMLGSSVAAAMAFIHSMLALATLLLGPQGALAMAGVGIYVVFMAVLAFASEGLAMGMNKFAENMGKVKLKELGIAVLLVAASIAATFAIVYVGIALAAVGLGMLVSLAGLAIAAAFWVGASASVGSILESINKLNTKIKNPKKAIQTVEILAKVVGAIASLADLAFKAKEFELIDRRFKADQASNATNKISSFVTEIVGSINSLMITFALMAVAFKDDKVRKGAEAVASIVGAVAQLAGSLAAPLVEIMKNKEAFKNKDAMISAMQQAQLLVGGVLKSIRVQLPKIVKNLVGALDGIKIGPKTIKRRAEALKALFEGLAAMITAINDIKEMSMRENIDGDGNKSQVFDRSVLMNLLRKVNLIISDPIIGKLIESAVAITGKVKYAGTLAKKMAKIGEFTASMVDMVRSLSGLGEFLKKGGTQGLEDLSVEWSKITEENSMMSPSYFVEAFHDEIKKIKSNWKELQADIGEVSMKPIIKGMLGAKGEYTVNIVPEAVNLTVSLNVTMDAKELAKSIAEGNSDTEGFFVITPKVDKSLLDMDGGGA